MLVHLRQYLHRLQQEYSCLMNNEYGRVINVRVVYNTVFSPYTVILLPTYNHRLSFLVCAVFLCLFLWYEFLFFEPINRSIMIIADVMKYTGSRLYSTLCINTFMLSQRHDKAQYNVLYRIAIPVSIFSSNVQ